MTKKKKITMAIVAAIVILIAIALAVVFLLPHVHVMKEVQGLDATCMEEGHDGYYECTKCNKFFADELGEMEVTKEEIHQEKAEHVLEYVEVVNPSFEKEGIKAHWKCEVCGKLFLVASCDEEVTEEDLVLAPLIEGEDSGYTMDTKEIDGMLVGTGNLKIVAGIEDSVVVTVSGDKNLTKTYRDGEQVSFTVKENEYYDVVSVSYGNKTLKATNGVYFIRYDGNVSNIYVEVESNHPDSTLMLPSVSK